MTVDDSLCHSESDALARKLALAVQALEGAEELVRIDHVEADAVVANEEPVLTCDPLGADGYHRLRLVARELPRIADEVGQQDAHEPGIARRCQALLDPKIHPALGLLRLTVGAYLGGDPVDVDLFAADVAAGQAEQGLHTVEQGHHLLAGSTQPHDLVLGGVAHDLGVVHQRLRDRVDRKQRRTQVV